MGQIFAEIAGATSVEELEWVKLSESFNICSFLNPYDNLNCILILVNNCNMLWISKEIVLKYESYFGIIVWGKINPETWNKNTYIWTQKVKVGSRNPLWRHSSAERLPDEWISAPALRNPEHLHCKYLHSWKDLCTGTHCCRSTDINIPVSQRLCKCII